MARRRANWQLLVWLIAMTAVEAAGAQNIYKWTDSSGTVHYAEQPPANGQATKMHVAGDHSEEPESAAQLMANLASGQEAVEQADAAQRKHLCEVARNNLKALDGQSMVVAGNSIADAKQLTEGQRFKARGEAQAQIGQYCNDR